MILHRVRLENWRAHRQLEIEFGAQLNIIEGRNEAGKSSLVEALDWALYRDVTGARLKSETICAIVPADDLDAAPRVEVELEFPDCRAILSKTLSEDAAKRSCVLTLKRPNYSDSVLERGEAQLRLKMLLAADGLGDERGAAQGALLVAHQGEGVDFLTDGGSAIRSTLGVGNDGELALTRRLDGAREEIEKMRKRELTLELSARAIDGARAGTDAARARDELRRAQTQKTHFEALAGEIEAIRDDIEKLKSDWETIAPREARAQKRIGELGDLMNRQTRADSALKDAQIAARDAGLAQKSLQKRALEIARLEREQLDAQRELEQGAAQLRALQERLDAAQNQGEAARGRAAQGEEDWAMAQDVALAWRAVFDVFEAQSRIKAGESALSELERLGARLQACEAEFRATDKAPSMDELREWRAAFERWNQLHSEAAQGLQIEIAPHAGASARWKADGGAIENLELNAGEKLNLLAMGRGVLDVARVAVFRFVTGARGIEEVRAELANAREILDKSLRPWKVAIEELPGAIEDWQAKRRALDEAQRAREEAVAALRREEERSGVWKKAVERVENERAEFAQLKENAKPFEGLISFRGLRRGEVKANLEEAQRAERAAGTLAQRARNEIAGADNDARREQNELAKISRRPDALRAAIEQRDRQIEKLRAEAEAEVESEVGAESEAGANQSDEARLGALSAAFLSAERERQKCEAARHELGDGVSQWRVEEARRAALELAGERGDIEKALVNLRADLRHACEQDPETKLAELDAQIAQWAPEVAAHEARLRGLALLHAAIEAERARLSHDLAGPINLKLSPWLSQLRGKTTQLQFDASGTRIESVTTTANGATIDLPFGEHSEGMKEQVAFALRLILAQRVAGSLPSGRLPVILDDPFTQSDSSRRVGLGEVLREAGQSLQIIFVTCHDAPPSQDDQTRRIRLGE